MKQRIKQLQTQYGIQLQPTGHHTPAKENGGVQEKEYKVTNLVKSPLQALNFDTGGWIRHDTRNQQTTAIITIKLNGEHISETRALKISYHNDKEKWGEPRWTTIWHPIQNTQV